MKATIYFRDRHKLIIEDLKEIYTGNTGNPNAKTITDFKDLILSDTTLRFVGTSTLVVNGKDLLCVHLAE
ncbi:MAG: hypothetical protein E7A50_05645 [Clostridiales bacterium]|uniref:Uncharacterized protein n=1 Tax=Peptococcus niger TaxID=2741 RepID=A0A1G6RMH9_PEPNI|nr:hypothetical protein [Peptococcus niger]MDU1028960.1 hypothetical protein [Clostridiales bacterium]SDD05205.1 hypothetical protein SAMN04489866_10154 [Peptococcus niger]